MPTSQRQTQHQTNKSQTNKTANCNLEIAGSEAEDVEMEVIESVEQGHADYEWPAMRTVADIRRSKSIGAPQNPDSYYQSLQRAPRQFPSLKVGA